MKQHTPEPWAWFETEDGAALCVAEGMAVARCNVHNPFGQDAINARRIAACVNACEGLPTEMLEECGIPSIARHMKIEKQRDELLAALIGLHATMACYDKTPEETLALAAAEEAIASVKGSAE